MKGNAKMETATKPNKKSSLLTIDEFINRTVSAAPQGGALDLDQIEKSLVNTPRRDVIKALRDSSAGVFVTGRKGHKSRWVFGPPAKEAQEKINLTRKYRKTSTNGRKRRHQAALHIGPVTTTPAPVPASNYQFKITVAGQEVVVPMTIELIAAAA